MMRRIRPEPLSITEILGDLSGLTNSQNLSERAQPSPEETSLSDLLQDPKPQKLLHEGNFDDGMLRAVRELNQDPELLREVSKRIS